MPRLPDRFDLWVRRAYECPDPARQADFVLGALAVLPEWYFLNIGTKEHPEPAVAEIEGANYLVVFTDLDRLLEIAAPSREEPPVITVATEPALAWCQNAALGYSGLLINPHPDGDAVFIPLEQVAAFFPSWQERRAQNIHSFWIPNLTTQEEDFWQEHGL